jgi:hypothetical protein
MLSAFAVVLDDIAAGVNADASVTKTCRMRSHAHFTSKALKFHPSNAVVRVHGKSALKKPTTITIPTGKLMTATPTSLEM